MAREDLRENPFRDEIFEYLLNSGYVESHKKDYDYKNALDTAKLFEFIENTQSEDFLKFKSTYGDAYKEYFIKLLNKHIENKGLLTALREEINDYASNSKFSLAYFKPNIDVMSEGISKYENNILSVRRELSYEDKEDSFRVDLAIFLNGIPIIMIELKKQTAGQKASFQGTNQFKYTRNPDELVFSFNKRTLVYFTLDEFEAFVTTRLDKKETVFLPFNQGSSDEGAGNPINYEGKHLTHYIWEETLQKDMLFKIIREFMFIDDEGVMIFPRYHQLDAVLKSEGDVKTKGVGGRYLIWHSAGSGKTKTIAWLSSRLINMPEINTVIVISDRAVIDKQLGNEITTSSGEKGIVKHIDTNSADLLKYLNLGGYVIVTTLQKFPFILEQFKDRANKKYVIIIDEAHSSTAGRTMSKLSETLSGKSLKDSIESEDIYEEMEDSQNIINKQKETISKTKNVSYFAFTATPKTETMEIFGTRTEKGKKYFHKYSMKQAIEEEFILNPVVCYTTYNEIFEIKKKKDDDTEYDATRASQIIMGHITSSKEVIETKAEIILSDFVTKRLNWLSGAAKAMLITPSRKHAVLYKLMIDKMIAKNGYGFKSVVAFTGTVEHDGVKYTEENMNKDFKEKDIKQIISNNDNARIIVVADKLQTGFDEKLLCCLYIDKRLNSAVKAVQTISRINRPCKGKKTFVLDFINNPETIKEYFEYYYGGDIYLPLDNETDPNILFAKRDTLLDYFVFTLKQVQEAYNLINDGQKHSGLLTSIFAGAREKYKKLEADKQKLFLGELSKFSKLFYYISTVYNIWNEELKEVAVFADALYNVLYQKKDETSIDPEELVELVKFSTEKVKEEQDLFMSTTEEKLNKINTEVNLKQKKFSVIDEIIEAINTKYGTYEKSEEELTQIVDIVSKDEDMQKKTKNSSPNAYQAEAEEKIDKIIINRMLESDGERLDFYTNISNDKQVLKELAKVVIHKIKDMLIAG